jgi:hypothetical protein
MDQYIGLYKICPARTDSTVSPRLPIPRYALNAHQLSRERSFSSATKSFFPAFRRAPIPAPVCDSVEGFERFCADLDVELHDPPSPVTAWLRSCLQMCDDDRLWAAISIGSLLCMRALSTRLLRNNMLNPTQTRKRHVFPFDCRWQ